MRKYAKFVICIALIIAVNTAAVYAADDADDDGIFSVLNDVKSEGSYLEYRDNYYLDMEDTSLLSSPGAIIFNTMANGIFGFSKNIGCLTAVATRFALGVDIYNPISDFVKPFFNSMRKIVFDSYATYFIAAAAFYFLIQLLRNRQMQVISGLLAVAVIIAVGLFFYARPMFVLSTLNNITTELSATVMDAPYDTLTGSHQSDQVTAEDKSAVLIFNVMVHSQWQYLEFGSLKQAKANQDEILPLEAESDERMDYISELEKPGLTKGNTASQIERFGLSLIFLLFNILLLIIILGFAVLILGYQFYVMFLALLGTFIFVLALIPGYGPRMLKRWALKLLTSSAVKIILVFFMSILFIIMNFLYTATETYGLLPVLFMMISMCIIVTAKRKDIAELFLGTPGGKVVRNTKDVAAGTYSDLAGFKNRITNLRRDEQKVGNEYDEYMSEEDLRKYRAREDASQRNNFHAEDSHASGSQKNVYVGKRNSETDSPTSAAGFQPQQEQYDFADRNLQGEYITGEDYKKAEEILQRNYELSKEKSEKIARESGEPVQYSDFVQRTDAVRDLGGSAMFDDRDILKTARILQRAEAAGGSMEDLIGDPQERNSGDLSEQEGLRPQSVMEYMESSAQDELRQGVDLTEAEDLQKEPEGMESTVTESVRTGESEVILSSVGMDGQLRNIEGAEVKGLNYFKSQFGDEKGEKYYEKMCVKYGEEAVSQFYGNREKEKMSFSEVNQMLRSNATADKADEK